MTWLPFLARARSLLNDIVQKGNREMLRITKTFEDDSSITVRLDGKIVSATAAELEEACRQYRNGGGKALSLDFSGVIFIDNDGLETLKKIKHRGIAMVNGSPFVETLLGGLEK
jgi:hypothetical protein